MLSFGYSFFVNLSDVLDGFLVVTEGEIGQAAYESVLLYGSEQEEGWFNEAIEHNIYLIGINLPSYPISP